MARNPERLRQIEDLFHAARACDADARTALLAGVDTDLRREVESLLYGERFLAASTHRMDTLVARSCRRATRDSSRQSAPGDEPGRLASPRR